MEQDTQKPLFISYNSADRGWAEWIAWQLEDAGYSTVIQAWDFRPGSNFVQDMDTAIQNAERTVAVLSPNYLNALYTQSEWSAAFSRDPKGELGILLPVLVQKCELKGLLAQIVYIDLCEQGDTEARERLLAGVRRSRAKPSSAPAFPGSSSQHTIPAPPHFPGALPPIWNVPYPRDPFFIGGEHVLANIHSALKVSKTVALISSQNGSSQGGVGKTQTVIEYTYRYSSDYQSVFWARADSYATLSKDFTGIARLLNLPEQQAQDQREVINAVKQWLQTHTQWLLILDNVEDQEVVKNFLPTGAQGHILLTARKQPLNISTQSVEIDKLNPQEEEAFRRYRTRIMKAVLRGPQGQTTLGAEPITIGRAMDNRLVVNSLEVSSRHAEVRLQGRGYIITDLGSTNGTFVNERKLEPRIPYVLNLGDTIRLGDRRFTYEASSSLPIEPAIPGAAGERNTSAQSPQSDLSHLPTRRSEEPKVAPPPPTHQGQQSYTPPPPQQQPYAPSYQQQSYAPPPPVSQQQAYSPYAAPPPMIAIPPTGQKKNRKLWLGLGIAGGALALCVVISLIAYAASLQQSSTGSSSPTQTLTTYCNALKSKDFTTAYNQLSSSAQSSVSFDSFSSTHSTVSGCVVNTPAANEVCYTFSTGSSEIFGYTFQSSDDKITSEQPGSTVASC